MTTDEAFTTRLTDAVIQLPSDKGRIKLWDRKSGPRELWNLAARPAILASGFLLLAVVSATSIFLVVTAQSNADLVQRTLGVQNDIFKLQIQVGYADSAQRGYMLTGNSTYYAIYEKAIDTVRSAIVQLRNATIDNANQQETLSELDPVIGEKIDDLEAALRQYAAGERAQAMETARNGHGRQLNDQIRSILDLMAVEEQSLLAIRSARADSTNVLLLFMNLAGTGFMIGLAAISLLTVRRMANDTLRDSEARAEELQVAVNDLEAFSYNISHDLRAPLRAIDGFTRIVLKQHSSNLATEPQELLQAVRTNAVQMGRLIDDLLAFSRLGRKALVKQQVELSSIVARVVREVQQAELRPLDVKIGYLVSVLGDSALLKQVFSNLIGNGVQVHAFPGRRRY